MAKTYDPACFNLAEQFLSDEPSIDDADRRHRLAQEIQGIIEDFIEDEKFILEHPIVRGHG